MKHKLIASVPAIVLGALIAVAPQTFAHACQGHGTPGACHYSQQAATGIGAAILVLGVIALFVDPRVRIGLNVAVIVDTVLLLAVPTVLIGICKGTMMHCRMVMLPTLVVLGVLALAFAVIGIRVDSRAASASAGGAR
ncbi:DUF4418 family protein [Bifidobacterium sp. MA2]|uniref:DUF4418 family protein n=1 Tax=Bifidobacterium santillanense TaxID=2809028 RepID=A0ABS5ULU3_9BIFI|nr:DUF4418 family protein [Bifidobacterium santillanense]MBT1171878.1 DUF4418 family protein [Bifidobacterium santillanense]